MERQHDIVGVEQRCVATAGAEPRCVSVVGDQKRTASVVEQRRASVGGAQEYGTVCGEDVRVAALRTAVAGLRRRLAVLPPDFPDRDVAEDELAALAAMTAHGVPELPPLHRSLLLVAGAIGSVSVLSRDLADVRRAMEGLGTAPRRWEVPSARPTRLNSLGTAPRG